VPNFIIKAALPAMPLREATQLDAKVLGSYAGLYRSKNLGIKLSVSAKSGRLFVRMGRGEQVEITPFSRNEFYGTMQNFGEFTIRFDEVGTRIKTALQLNYGFFHEPFDRVRLPQAIEHE
jgi:hypothetical protein